MSILLGVGYDFSTFTNVRSYDGFVATTGGVIPQDLDLEIVMSIVYGVLMIGVALILFATFIETAVSLSRKPVWAAKTGPHLQVVPVVERRKQQLPFVGVDRRQARQHERPELKRAA